MARQNFNDMVPLWLFTTFSGLAAGWMVGVVGIYGFGVAGGAVFYGLGAVVVVAVLGLMVSLFHLGQKQRLLRSVLGVGHSWLSREVVVVGVFVGLCGLALWGYRWGGWGEVSLFPLLLITAFWGVVLVVAISLVYRLPARRLWSRRGNVLAMPVTACLLGVVVWGQVIRVGWIVLLFWLLWGLDMGLALSRWLDFKRFIGNPHSFLFPRFLAVTNGMFVFRLVLALGVAGLWLFIQPQWSVVWVSGMIGLDRLVLYLSMEGSEPEAEIARLKAQRMRDAVTSSAETL